MERTVQRLIALRDGAATVNPSRRRRERLARRLVSPPGRGPMASADLRAVLARIDDGPGPLVAEPPLVAVPDTDAAPRATARMALLATAPKRLFVWWDAPEAAVARARRGLGSAVAETAAPAIRFYDVTDLDPDGGRWHHQFDIDVQLDDRRLYLDLWTANRAYVAELVLRGVGGCYVPLARSRPVRNPRDGEGPAADPRLLAVEANALVSTRPAGWDEAEVAFAVPPAEDHAERDLDAERSVRAAYRRYADDGARALRPLAGLEPKPLSRRRREFERRRRETPPEPPPPLTPWLLARLDRPAKVKRSAPLAFPPTLAAPVSAPAAELASALAAEAVRRAAQGEEIPEPVAVTYDAGSILALEPGLRETPGQAEPWVMDSTAVGVRERPVGTLAEAGVKLEIEVVIRGRAQPGRRVRIAGEWICPEADGSFRLACVVREGRLRVPVEAVAAESCDVLGREIISLETVAP